MDYGIIGVMITPETWKEYEQTKSKEIFNDLVIAYMPLVKYVASRLHSTMSNNIDRDDLESDGMFGLMEAIDRYDINRGIKFESYAVTRIRGAMIDKLRANDWVPRSVKGRIKQVKTAKEELQEQLDRTPTLKEVSKRLGETEHWVRKVETSMNSNGMYTLDAPVNEDEQSGVFSDFLVGGDTVDRNETILMVRNYLAKVLQSLNERERIIFTLYYYENLSLSEIGKLMGITESRVCQIHGKAIQDAQLKLVNNIL